MKAGKDASLTIKGMALFSRKASAGPLPRDMRNALLVCLHLNAMGLARLAKDYGKVAEGH